jgi:phenylacetate-coenzyme A ligase PaaK-like adenylate-forming protein
MGIDFQGKQVVITGDALRQEISQRLRQRIGLRADVDLVAPGTLPRFELKARRFFKL